MIKELLVEIYEHWFKPKVFKVGQPVHLRVKVLEHSPDWTSVLVEGPCGLVIPAKGITGAPGSWVRLEGTVTAISQGRIHTSVPTLLCEQLALEPDYVEHATVTSSW